MKMSDEDMATVVGSAVPHTRNRSKSDTVMVSFRLDKEIKEKAARAAEQHGRTMSKQFTQSLMDGLALQEIISEVNDHLTETIEVGGKEFVYKPDEETCLDYIISATQLIIEKEKREKQAK